MGKKCVIISKKRQLPYLVNILMRGESDDTFVGWWKTSGAGL